MYDGKVCEWVISDITWEEWSFVNLPSDEYAGITNYSTKENLNLFTNQESHIFAAESIKGTFFFESANDNNHDNKGGKPMDELKKNLKEMQEKLNSALEELKESKASVETLTAEANSLTEQLEEKTNEIETLKEAKVQLETTIEELTQEVTSLKSEKEELATKYEELVAENHKQVAEQVVDKKISLGRILEEKRDEAIASHLERSLDSLKDNLNDLAEEKNTSAILPRIKDPGALELDNINEHHEDELNPNLKDILFKAFSGKR